MELNFSVEAAKVFSQPLAIYTLGIVLYSTFIFHFYKFIARREIFPLHLTQYNRSNHKYRKKFFHFILYVLEYLIIFPIMVFFWFAVFTILLLYLSKSHTLETTLLIAGAIVSAIRVTAYISEDLSKDLAKMLPFALLGIFLIDISFVNGHEILDFVPQVQALYETLIYYFIFVIAIEFILRFARLTIVGGVKHESLDSNQPIDKPDK